MMLSLYNIEQGVMKCYVTVEVYLHIRITLVAEESEQSPSHRSCFSYFRGKISR
jgi:hypothetical protein